MYPDVWTNTLIQSPYLGMYMPKQYPISRHMTYNIIGECPPPCRRHGTLMSRDFVDVRETVALPIYNSFEKIVDSGQLLRTQNERSSRLVCLFGVLKPEPKLLFTKSSNHIWAHTVGSIN